jgi:predicted aspartyl protease
MSSFTTQVANLQASGPVVQGLRVAVGSAAEEALKKAGQHVPDPAELTVLIDTGATGTVIRPGVAGQLGLKPVGVVKIDTPSSNDVPCEQYALRPICPNNVTAECTAIEAPLVGQDIQVLIGRDVLAHGVLVYIGYANLFSLSF